jgi:hypothetical protein
LTSLLHRTPEFYYEKEALLTAQSEDRKKLLRQQQTEKEELDRALKQIGDRVQQAVRSIMGLIASQRELKLKFLPE